MNSKSSGARRVARYLRPNFPGSVGQEKYSARARAVLAVCRYYLGLPFHRIAGYQAMLGVPLPDATQWELIETGWRQWPWGVQAS